MRDGQNAARPKMASSAGIRVRPAASISAIAMASGTPRAENSPNTASSRVSRAAMTVAAENVTDSPTRASALTTASCERASRPELLAHPEDQEQAVVRARADHQDQQEDLGQRRNLEPGLAGLGDHRPGQLGDEHGGRQGEQRRQHGPEHSHQQDQDEHDRQVLAQIARAPRTGWRQSARPPGRPGARAGQAAARGPRRPGAGRPPAARRARVAHVDPGQHQQLDRPPVGADAQVLDLADRRHRGQPGG